MDSPAGPLRLIGVDTIKLGHVADAWYFEEGCQTPSDFIDIWKRIHPRKGFDADAEVVAHWFEVVR